MVKKVLLIADVGTTDYGFYHVGDEAMFYETCRWYQKNLPTIKIGALSRSKSHSHLRMTEHLHLLYPTNPKAARWYFFRLIVKTIIHKYTHINLYRRGEAAFIRTILRYDILHFSGGGNIYSISVSWLYYAYFLIFVFSFYGKRVILTSQTIGPLWGIDRLAGVLFLNLPTLIALREPGDARQSLRKYLIFRPTVCSMVDIATYLPMKSTYRLPGTKRLRIGISVHALPGHEETLLNTLKEILMGLRESNTLEVVLIPHVLVNKTTEEWDLWYMHRFVALLPKSSGVKIVEASYTDIVSSAVEPAMTVKYL